MPEPKDDYFFAVSQAEAMELAARKRDSIRTGTDQSEDGPPAPTSADHHLIEQSREALAMLESRQNTNGIGWYAHDAHTVAQKIRNAARKVFCPQCGRVGEPTDKELCSCPRR